MEILIITNNSSSFKYKSSVLEQPTANEVLKKAKVAVPLKYLRNFWQFLEIPFIICKINPEFNWTKHCVISEIVDNTTVKITNTELCIPIVILSIEDNVKLTKQLNEGFKKPVYWNELKPERIQNI